MKNIEKIAKEFDEYEERSFRAQKRKKQRLGERLRNKTLAVKFFKKEPINDSTKGYL